MLHRKTVTLVEEYDYICQSDDAVHQADPEFAQKWEQYLDGQIPPPLVPGGKPTKFRLRHLNSFAQAQLARYIGQAQEDSSRWPEALAAAFSLGIVSVENYPGRDGKPLRVKVISSDGVPTMSPDMAGEFELDTVLEVGGRVLARMAPGPK